MQFYPHNISTALVGSSVSASLALSGSFINNFEAIPINTVATASLALNITGSRGADGTGAVVVGPKGATGTRGVTGFRGDSVFLLSGSWHSGAPCTAPPVNCYAFDFGASYSVGGVRYCDFGSVLTYYSTDSTLSAGSSPIYFNSICTTLAANQTTLGAYVSTAYSTDGSGILQTIEACSEAF
jgi:hypothetical protein